LEDFIADTLERMFPENQSLVSSLCNKVQEDPKPTMEEVDGASIAGVLIDDIVHDVAYYGGVYSGVEWDDLTLQEKQIRALTLISMGLVARYSETVYKGH